MFGGKMKRELENLRNLIQLHEKITRGDIASLRAELRAELRAARAVNDDLRAQNQALRAEVKAELHRGSQSPHEQQRAFAGIDARTGEHLSAEEAYALANCWRV